MSACQSELGLDDTGEVSRAGLCFLSIEPVRRGGRISSSSLSLCRFNRHAVVIRGHWLSVCCVLHCHSPFAELTISVSYIQVNRKNPLAYILAICEGMGMKTRLITFKASPEEKARWDDALEKDGRSLSEVVRASLDRLAKKIEGAAK